MSITVWKDDECAIEDAVYDVMVMDPGLRDEIVEVGLWNEAGNVSRDALRSYLIQILTRYLEEHGNDAGELRRYIPNWVYISPSRKEGGEACKVVGKAGGGVVEVSQCGKN